MQRALPLLVPAALAACTPAPPPRDRASCGVMAVRHVSGPRVDPAGPIPACSLPTPGEIARACEPKMPLGAGGFSALLATGVSCRFTDARRSRATCTFSLMDRPRLHGETGPPPRQQQHQQIRETFIHRYDEVHEADASGFGTYWFPAGQCMTRA